MNNKYQKIINYLSISAFIIIIFIVLFFSYNQKYKENIKINFSATTSTTLFSFIHGGKYFLTKEFLLDLFTQSGIKVSENFNYDLLQDPQIQKTLIAKLEPFIVEIVNRQSKEGENLIRELAIILKPLNGGVAMVIDNLSSPKYLQRGDLVIFAINVNDALRKVGINFTSEDVLYFCGVTKPSLILEGAKLYYKDFGDTIVYPEGQISCSNGLKMDINHLGWSIGFVEGKDYQLKIYLVSPDTKEKIKKILTLKEGEEILENHSLIYEREININNQK